MQRPLVASTTLLSVILAYSSCCNNVNAFIVPTALTSRLQVQRTVAIEQHAELSTNNSITTEREEEDDESKLISNEPSPPTKLLRLKDRMWVRETLEDLTAAEFACNLAPRVSSEEEDEERKKNEKSSVDFENLLAKLDKRIEDMCVRSTFRNTESTCIVAYPTQEPIPSSASPDPEDECWSLMENYGMGCVTYTDDQRSSLVL